jgi:hypothetical protein
LCILRVNNNCNNSSCFEKMSIWKHKIIVPPVTVYVNEARWNATCTTTWKEIVQGNILVKAHVEDMKRSNWRSCIVRTVVIFTLLRIVAKKQNTSSYRTGNVVSTKTKRNLKYRNYILAKTANRGYQELEFRRMRELRFSQRYSQKFNF